MPRHIAWQAWRLATSTFVSRGRRDTGLALVARLGPDWSPVTPRHFAWQAWHLVTSTFVSRGRRGTRRHLYLRFTWQAWHLGHWAGSGGALGPGLVAGDAAALCVAGLALGNIYLRFTWRAWHLAWQAGVVLIGTGLALVARLGPDWSPVTPRHFAWQAWHLATSIFVSRDRRGTWRHLPSFHVAGVALRALGWLWWRAWESRWCRSTLRGRRGTCRHPPSFRVAGVELMALGWLWWRPWARLGALGRRWRCGTLCGRRGTWWHPPSFYVAGVALGHIHLCFAWQARTHHLSHTIFVTHTRPSFTHHLSHTSRSSTTSFVFPSSPSPLQHLVLIIGRSCLVGLSGPLII